MQLIVGMTCHQNILLKCGLSLRFGTFIEETFMPKRPVGKICPSCGSNEYSLCKPEGFVSFAKDRKCKKCETRYKVPTPWWAAIIFVIAGIPMFFGGLAAFGLILLSKNVAPMGLALFACLAAVGAMAVWHGARSIIHYGEY